MTKDDASFLLGRPEFRRFIYAAIQSAGVLGISAPANGHSNRNLEFFEGRRSLGFELLQMAEQGQPEALRTPDALATLNTVILETINAPPAKEKSRADRYDDVRD